MPFTGGQFRVKIETEPSTWFRELQSVTGNINLKTQIIGKFMQILSKQWSKNG